MASYVNITLDTVGVVPLSVSLNGDDERTTSTAVTLKVTLSEEDMANADKYQMAILGDIAGLDNSTDMPWEPFVSEKTITLTDGDGIKVVHVYIMDDLGNIGNYDAECGEDTIILYTEIPTVTVIGPTVARISENEGYNVSTFTFTADKKISDCKVMVVKSINSLHDDATNVLLSGANGSKITYQDTDGNTKLASDDDLSFSFGEISSFVSFGVGKELTVTVYGSDLFEAAGIDGAHIIKVFVKETDGSWSV